MLEPGVRIGRYEVIDRIGVGGMGEVYRARDKNLQRIVAIKILPPHLVSDHDCVRHFVNEARAASALNHPHIVHLYDAGEQNGLYFIATEFVDGLTLRERLQSRPGLSTVSDWLAQVADALAKAHASGIIHRDVKPENIMISSDGYAKLLDFGLAKLLDGADGIGPTSMTAEQSQPGAVVGTPSYMAPEQVQGRQVDHRADVFALGSILYEGITGHRAFSGASAVDVMLKIAYEEPDLSTVEDPEAQRIVRKCLAKKPDARYQSTRDLALDIRELRQSSISAERTAVVRPQPRRTALWAVIAAAAAVLLVVSAVAWRLAPIRRETSAARRTFAIEPVSINENPKLAAISPDGRTIAFTVTGDKGDSVWLRQRATASSIALFEPSGATIVILFFSRDGDYVYFVSSEPKRGLTDLYRLPTIGGEPVLVADDVLYVAASKSGRLAFTRNKGSDESLMLRAADGTERPLATFNGAESVEYLSWSPDETRLAATYRQAGARRVRVWNLQDGTSAVLGQSFQDFEDLSWTPDQKALLAVAARSPNEPHQLWRIGYPGGESEPLTNDDDDYTGVSVTADGQQILTVQTHVAASLWTMSRSEPDHPKMIVASVPKGARPTWTSDGRIVYVSSTSGSRNLWMIDADGTHPRQLTSAREGAVAGTMAPDGRRVAWAMNLNGASNIWVADAVPGAVPRQLTQCAMCSMPRFSADSRSVFYVSRSGSATSTYRVGVDGSDPRLVADSTGPPIPAANREEVLCDYWPKIPGLPKLAVLRASDGAIVRTFDTVALWGGYTWGDNGSMLFIPWRSGLQNIWELSPDGQQRQLTNFTSASVLSFDYDPKRSEFVMTRGVSERKVLLLKSGNRAER